MRVPEASGLETDAAVNVVIAYEDLESGKQAKRTYDFLAQHMGGDCVFALQMWKFDVLSIAKLRELAARDALMAEVIIVSCRGDHDLSVEVKAWVDSWLSEKGNAIALVALVAQAAGDGTQTRAIRDYLADVARRGSMEFFSHPDRWPDGKAGELFPSRPDPKLDVKTLSSLAGAAQWDLRAPHWGIND